MKKALLTGVAALFLATGTVHAADFTIEGSFYVYINGDIVEGDAAKFDRLVQQIQQGDGALLITLNSDGGLLSEGLAIAETITTKRFPTRVLSGNTCASVCGLIWLAGVLRHADVRARIGFHAIYDVKNGHEIGMGNAMVGAFLTKLGYPYETVAYVTSARPKSMAWLTYEDAVQYGISYTAMDATKKGYFVDVCPKTPTTRVGEGTILMPPNCLKRYW